MARAGSSIRRPTSEVADILRRHGEAYLRDHAGHVGRTERRVISAITACRTAALGGHVEACDDCGATRIAYNSCRNRHCPKCQGAARAQWLAERQAELLPVPYFHVVFTLPPPIAAIAFQNKAAVYADPVQERRRGHDHAGRRSRAGSAPKIGGLAILHTWGQALTHHPACPLRRPRRRTFARQRPMDRRARRTSFLPSSRSPGYSAASSSNACKPPSTPALSASSAISRIWPIPLPSPLIWPPRGASIGSSMPRSRSAARRKFSPISGATRIASPSPTAASSSLDDDHVAFTWKDYRHQRAAKVMKLGAR